MNNRISCIATEFMATDILLGLFGREIGSGAHRRVFEAGWDPKLVIKIEQYAEVFANNSEFSIWTNLKGTPDEKWLCPCIMLSPGSTALVMRRADPITDVSVLPKRLPWWATDIKPENWGMLDGRPVMVDYANHRFFSQGRGVTRRIKKWHAGAHAELQSTGPHNLVPQKRKRA